MSEVDQYRRHRQGLPGSPPADSLADVLERVLDKGIVIAGDIKINLLEIELLTIRLRLLVASVDKAKEMGIDWWQHDPALTSSARELEDENAQLRRRLARLEEHLGLPEGREGDRDEERKRRPSVEERRRDG